MPRTKSEAAFASRMSKPSIDPLDVSPKKMAMFIFADFNDTSVVKPKHGINVKEALQSIHVAETNAAAISLPN